MPPLAIQAEPERHGVGQQPIRRANATGRLDRAAANLRHRNLVHYSPISGILPPVLRWLPTQRLVGEEKLSGWNIHLHGG